MYQETERMLTRRATTVGTHFCFVFFILFFTTERWKVTTSEYNKLRYNRAAGEKKKLSYVYSVIFFQEEKEL